MDGERKAYPCSMDNKNEYTARGKQNVGLKVAMEGKDVLAPFPE